MPKSSDIKCSQIGGRAGIPSRKNVDNYLKTRIKRETTATNTCNATEKP